MEQHRSSLEARSQSRRTWARASLWAVAAIALLGAAAVTAAVSPYQSEDSSPSVPPTQADGLAARAALDGNWTRFSCGDCVQAIVTAKDSIWTGSISGGILRWSPDGRMLQRWTAAEGLSGNMVHAIAVAPDQSVWAATAWRSPLAVEPEGLSVHRPGEGWTHVRLPDDLDRIGWRSMAADREGLWVAAGDGLRRYSGGAWSRIAAAQIVDDGSSISGVYLAQDESLWLSTTTGLVRRTTRGDWSRLPWPDDRPAFAAGALHITVDGQIWVAVADLAVDPAKPDGIMHFDGRDWTHHGLDRGLREIPIISITTTADGRVWASHNTTSEDGLSAWDGRAWRTWGRAHGLPGSIQMRVATAPDGKLWATSVDGGIARLEEGDRWETIRTPEGPHRITTFDIEPGDGLWFSHFNLDIGGSGYISHRGAEGWRDFGVDDGLLEVEATLMNPAADGAVDADGAYWRGVEGSAQGEWVLARYDGRETRFFGDRDGLPSGAVSDLASTADGAVWAAYDQGLFRWDGVRWEQIALQGLPSSEIDAVEAAYDLFGEPDGGWPVWVGGDDFVARRDWIAGPSAPWTVYRSGSETGLPHGRIVDIVSEIPGPVWVVTDRGDVSRSDGSRWTTWTEDEVFGATGGGTATSIQPDLRGGVWVGRTADRAQDAGAAYFDGTSWQAITPDLGLDENSIYDIARGKYCEIWFAGLTTVFRFAPTGGCARGGTIPSPTPTSTTCVCDSARDRAPASALAAALADPDSISGWQQARDPNKPVGPFNPLRECLGLSQAGRVYHPINNGLRWQAGCP